MHAHSHLRRSLLGQVELDPSRVIGGEVMRESQQDIAVAVSVLITRGGRDSQVPGIVLGGPVDGPEWQGTQPCGRASVGIDPSLVDKRFRTVRRSDDDIAEPIAIDITRSDDDVPKLSAVLIARDRPTCSC